MTGTNQHDVEQTRNELAVFYYDELRRQARRLMHGNENLTLQPTALVNEAYLKIAKNNSVWADRKHFLRSASTTLRHILVDYFRGKNATTRPIYATDAELDRIVVEFDDGAIDLLALNDILEELGESNPYGAQLIDMRFFGGASNQEMADALQVSLRTAQRDLRSTKDWIHSRLTESQGR